MSNHSFCELPSAAVPTCPQTLFPLGSLDLFYSLLASLLWWPLSLGGGDSDTDAFYSSLGLSLMFLFAQHSQKLHKITAVLCHCSLPVGRQSCHSRPSAWRPYIIALSLHWEMGYMDFRVLLDSELPHLLQQKCLMWLMNKMFISICKIDITILKFRNCVHKTLGCISSVSMEKTIRNSLEESPTTTKHPVLRQN